MSNWNKNPHHLYYVLTANIDFRRSVTFLLSHPETHFYSIQRTHLVFGLLLQRVHIGPHLGSKDLLQSVVHHYEHRGCQREVIGLVVQMKMPVTSYPISASVFKGVPVAWRVSDIQTHVIYGMESNTPLAVPGNSFNRTLFSHNSLRKFPLHGGVLYLP